MKQEAELSQMKLEVEKKPVMKPALTNTHRLVQTERNCLQHSK